MTEEMFQDMVREREEWLAGFGRIEADVHIDLPRDLEFIISESEDEEGKHFTRIYIPFQYQQIYKRYYKN